jgi:predicted nucleic acid-binding protein
MASSFLLDTSGWLMLLNSGDPHHDNADAVWRDCIRHGYRIVVTDWIIAETGNGSARSRSRHRVAEAVRATLRDARVELVFVDSALLHRSLDLFGKHTDKSWGLVDCASFVVMQERGITEAFTSDQHFEQAGFKRLLIP